MSEVATNNNNLLTPSTGDTCIEEQQCGQQCEPNDNKSMTQLHQLLTEALTHKLKDEVLILLRDYVNNNNGDWREFLMWDDKRYTRNLVIKNEFFEMLILCWNEGQQSPIHDHNGSDCWMAFLSGEAEETYYYIEREKEDPTECPDLRRGDSHVFGEGEVSYIADELALHRIRPVKGRAVSLHVYSPPITTCSVYLQDLNRVTHPRSTYYSVNKQRVIDP